MQDMKKPLDRKVEIKEDKIAYIKNDKYLDIMFQTMLPPDSTIS